MLPLKYWAYDLGDWKTSKNTGQLLVGPNAFWPDQNFGWATGPRCSAPHVREHTYGVLFLTKFCLDSYISPQYHAVSPNFQLWELQYPILHRSEHARMILLCVTFQISTYISIHCPAAAWRISHWSTCANSQCAPVDQIFKFGGCCTSPSTDQGQVLHARVDPRCTLPSQISPQLVHIITYNQWWAHFR